MQNPKLVRFAMKP